MRAFRTVLASAWGAVAMAFTAIAAGTGASPLLHVPLRDGVTPAAGAFAATSTTNGCRFVPGRRGNALSLDAEAARLSYAAPVDPLRGSVAFWFKLAQPPSAAAKPIPILQLQGGSETLALRTEVNAYGTLMLAAGGYRTALATTNELPAWLGRWHHAVFTWTGTFLHWYVDGVEPRTLLFSGGDDETQRPITGRLDAFMSFPPPEGSARTRLSFSDTASVATIEDLAVYGWALSPRQAQQLAEAVTSAELVPAGPVVDVVWGPGNRRVDLVVDAAPAGLACASADILVVNTATRRAAGPAAIAAFAGGLGAACFDVPGLAAGTYRVDVALKDARGRTIGTASSASWSFDREKYPWLWNDIGVSAAVPAPWTPVVVSKSQVRMWGRVYDLGVLGLPAAITAADEPILARPIALVAETESGPVAWQRAKPPAWDVTEPAQAKGRAVARSESLELAAAVTAEYDGALAFELRLASRNAAAPAGLTALHLDIPLREAHASLLNAWAGLYFAGLVPPGEGRVWDALALPRRPGAFVPFVWIGDDERGLAWYADSDEGFARSGTNAPVEVIRREGEVLLRVHLVDRPLTLVRPRTLRFGLMATPVKPLPPHWRAMELGGTAVQDGPNYFWWWPGTEGRRTTGWAGFEPYPNPAAEGRAFARRAHADGRYVVPFINAHYTGGLPAHDFWEELRRFPDGGLAYENPTRAVQDFNLHHLDRWSQGDGAIDGLYIDESYVCGPAVNPLGGMGYYDDDGVLHAGYGLLQVRQYFKRLYTMFRQRGRDGMIWQHATFFHIPFIAAFAGTANDGENDLVTAGDDYIDHLLAPEPVGRSDFKGRLGRLRAIARSQNYGVPGSYLRYTSPAHDPALVAQHAAVMGLCDIIPVEEDVRFRAAKQEFGIGADDVRFLPFWDSATNVVVEPAGVLVSVYHRPDQDLYYVVNGQRADVEATITPQAASGVTLAGRAVYDPFTRQPVACDGQSLRLPLASHGSRLVLALPPVASRASTGLCFRVDFEGTPDARESRNTGYGRPAGSRPAFAAGRAGQGLLLGRLQGLVHYFAVDNMNPLDGTLVYWIMLRRPVTQWYQFMSVPAGAGVQFGLGTSSANPLVMSISPRWQATAAKQAPWETNVWRHVAVSWTEGRQFRMYVDGEPTDALVLSGDVPLPAADYPGWITLGSAPRQGDTSSDLVLDELAIYDHALTPGEIKALPTATTPRHD